MYRWHRLALQSRKRIAPFLREAVAAGALLRSLSSQQEAPLLQWLLLLWLPRRLRLTLRLLHSA